MSKYPPCQEEFGAQIKLIFDRLATLTAVADSQGQVLYANPALRHLCKVAEDATAGLSLGQLFGRILDFSLLKPLFDVALEGAMREMELSLKIAPTSEKYRVLVQPLTCRCPQIHTVQIFMEISKDSCTSRLLLKGASSILNSPDFLTAAHKIFDACREITGARSGYVALLDEENDNNEVLFLDAGGLPCSVDANLPMPIRGLRAETYSTHKVNYHNDFMKSEWTKFIPEGHVSLKNVLFVPLNLEGKTVGIIGLANKDGDFTASDAAVTGTFGELAAVALKKAHVEESLKAERDFAQTVIETAQAIVLILDNAGKIVSFNPYMERLSGYSLDECRGKDWISSFIPAEFRSNITQILQQSLTRINVRGNINPILTKNGSWRYISWYDNTLKDSKGNTLRVLAVGQDITEQRAFEERLRKSEKMEAIGQLAGGIAHDFNNILGGIIGYTDLCLDYCRKDSPLENYLNQILKASGRAKNLVKQILSFTQLHSEEKTSLWLKPVLEEVLQLLKASLPSTVNIKAELAEDAGIVLANSNKIHELVLNLCTNAVDAMNNRGVLTIKLYREFVINSQPGIIGDIKPGAYAVVEISDTGTGIPQAVLDRMFEPFFTTKPTGKGTGMGLAVVFGIVQSYNGNITVENPPTSGSCFKIYLPHTEKPAELAPASRGTTLRGTESILFVDDEMLLTNMADKMLSSLGYRVFATDDCALALAKLKENPTGFDLLITDQTMPAMTGLKLSAQALAIRKNLPIILCTGYSAGLNEDTVHEHGIAAYCQKPISRELISRLIRDVLDGSQVHG